MIKRLIGIFTFCFWSGLAFSQTDSLIFDNQNLILGEVKKMERGVLTVKTSYSDSDFKTDWEKLVYIKSNANFLVTLSDGKRYNGKIASVSDTEVKIDFYNPEWLIRLGKQKDRDGAKGTGSVIVPIKEIVFLTTLDEGFWSRLSASIDFGWSLTKANELQTFNLRSRLGYLADRSKFGFSFNRLRSDQREIEAVRRTDANLSYVYFLQRDYFLLYDLTFLSNTAQLVRSRVGNKIGVGKYVVRTNKSYFGFQVGVNLNNEQFSDDNPGNRSGESFFGAELSLYDIGDLKLLSNLSTYPSLTERGRFRSDFKLDIKYEFLSDFYVNLGTTLNFDNQPVEAASRLDYIIQTTVGWSL
ncbi:Protein of unknown function, DUF481 [Algoriphagus faecimaris]|uniref:Salt-induced outer membrane protein YdiY n=1 Tax=Algoriphagus faecimaris TaxID=686796 RepID=A0A1G6R7G8_9BACT|nr:DUF481 domain-containing protein [Algoriphagus faecimaris]SDC99987.1 Protein of unknown function, DUF481 [Algoriphagus faecimaris]